MRVDFYHLSKAPVEQVLPRIAERILEAGERLLVVSTDEQLTARIDQMLWTYDPASFLPHGREGEPDAAVQPILIAPAPNAINDARNVALCDGVWRDEALGFDRAFHFFDDVTIDAARAAWRTLAARESAERNFWKQDQDGRWRQQA